MAAEQSAESSWCPQVRPPVRKHPEEERGGGGGEREEQEEVEGAERGGGEGQQREGVPGDVPQLSGGQR